jgi:hypothetical protein
MENWGRVAASHESQALVRSVRKWIWKDAKKTLGLSFSGPAQFWEWEIVFAYLAFV